ncbi:MAG TPA: ribbon-helix-helix domain-containing protein [Candidatus Heimdallarchaeota archaeon]|nr:ribbon-helix-helix domain-containing protein [Candidatus Heimdallarchaeota archaeon]
MGKTIKFAISMSEEEFKELESLRQRTGRTRSQFMRDTVRAWKEEFMRPLGLKEKAEDYKREVPNDLIDNEERRRRAIAAAGRFRSDISDLSLKHDEYLEDIYAEIAQKKDNNKTK